MRFQARDRRKLYEWVSQILGGQDYGRLKRASKGLVRELLGQDDGTEPGAGGAIDPVLPARRRGEAASVSAAPFPQRYTRSDIELLAEVDEAPRRPERSGHTEDSAAGAA